MGAPGTASTHRNHKSKSIAHSWRGYRDYCYHKPIPPPYLACADDNGKWQWTIKSLTRWWLQLQVLHQMWFPCLNKWTYPWYLVYSCWSSKCFFSWYLLVKPTRSSSLLNGKVTNILHCPTLGYISSPALCHNLAHENLDHFSLPQGITLVPYIDDIMLIGPGQQEVAMTLDLSVRCLHVTRWEINPKRS